MRIARVVPLEVPTVGPKLGNPACPGATPLCRVGTLFGEDEGVDLCSACVAAPVARFRPVHGNTGDPRYPVRTRASETAERLALS